jgi:hypothetical protein
MTTFWVRVSKEEQVMLDRKRIRHNLMFLYFSRKITRPQLESLMERLEGKHGEGEEIGNTGREN